ncbi:MAG: alpha/beta fold hydrolase [Bacteroidetes bacterium]|nr:MAG: alpha/beta fold hydrolase [Bacteroidota bacterium]
MKLNYKKLGSGEPLIILHGLMGMLDNWLTPAKKLAEHFEVFLVDQRNHGHSPHSEEFNYQVMMEDLLEFFDDVNLLEAHILGHSMGGKTAMKFAQNYPEYVTKLIVADIAPKKYPVHHQLILQGLRAIDLNKVSSRKEADEILSQYVPEFAVRQFLLKNLYWKEKNKLAWRFNLDAIEKNIELIGEEINDRIFEKPALFLKGEKSDYITEEDYEMIKMLFPQSSIQVIPNAGHWLHAEQPELFIKAVIDFLNS